MATPTENFNMALESTKIYTNNLNKLQVCVATRPYLLVMIVGKKAADLTEDDLSSVEALLRVNYYASNTKDTLKLEERTDPNTGNRCYVDRNYREGASNNATGTPATWMN